MRPSAATVPVALPCAPTRDERHPHARSAQTHSSTFQLRSSDLEHGCSSWDDARDRSKADVDEHVAS